MQPILRDNGLSELVAGDLETIASGFEFTEGPLELADGSILFQDIKSERTHCFQPDGTTTTLREQTHAANGQTFDRSGRIVFCEQNGRRVSRMNPNGSNVETVVELYDGKRVNSPNDIICRSDGTILFTDPPYGVTPELKELAYQAVFAFGVDGRLTPLVVDFEKPNGLALSPDESTLYVCDTAKYHVRAFDLVTANDGTPKLENDRVFATMDPGRPGGPDGMKVDREGRVYVAVALGIWVYDPSGIPLGILSIPQRPSNLAWSGADAKTLIVTAVDHVHRVKLDIAGIKPPFQTNLSIPHAPANPDAN